jgi:hypothetical protein
MIFFAGIQIAFFPKINQVYNIFNSKPVMNAVFYLSSFIYSFDFMSGYILSLTRSKKLLMLLKTEDICYVDCSQKLANKLIAFVIFNTLVLGSMCIYFSLNIPVEVSIDSQIGKSQLLLLLLSISVVFL